MLALFDQKEITQSRMKRDLRQQLGRSGTGAQRTRHFDLPVIRSVALVVLLQLPPARV